MSENKTPGSAAAALAAHSKDASTAGQTPASSTMGESSGAKATDGVEHIRTSVREAAGNAREALAGQGGYAVDQAENFIREQPFVALAVTGMACLALGLLLGRR